MNFILNPTNSEGGIYLGNINAANNLILLQKNNIRAVITIASKIKQLYNEEVIPYHQLIILSDDEKIYHNIWKKFIISLIVHEN